MEDQKYLDLYQEGKISEAEFEEKAWHWGFDYELYKNILDLLRKNRCKGVALNISMPLTQKISEKILANGFESLSAEEKKFFPKDGFKIFCDEGKYHDAIMRGFEAMREWGIVMPQFEKKFHISQWVMNETMAASILNYFDAASWLDNKNSASAKMMVAVGWLHVVYNEGIAASVGHRNPELKQITVLMVKEDEIIKEEILEEKPADFLLIYKQKEGR